MFGSNKVGRFCAAVTLAAVFFLAMPVAAADGRESPAGLFERLIEWVVVSLSTSGTKSDDREGAYIDPNGGGHTGSCSDPLGCDDPLPTASVGGS